MQKCDNAVVGEKLTGYESSVRGCIVTMQQPVGCVPLLRSFSQNDRPQTAKNNAAELSVHSLPLRGKFMVHNPSNVEKCDEKLVSKHFDTPTYLTLFKRLLTTTGKFQFKFTNIFSVSSVYLYQMLLAYWHTGIRHCWQ
jgi:hypothetical protein